MRFKFRFVTAPNYNDRDKSMCINEVKAKLKTGDIKTVVVNGTTYVRIAGDSGFFVYAKGDLYVKDNAFVEVPESWFMEDVRQKEVLYRPLDNL